MSKSRIIAAYIFTSIGFLILLGRYAYLQLYGHGQLLQQSISNYSSVVATLPVRGAILDRNGTVLADNKTSYVIAGLPKDIRKNHDIFAKIQKYANITELDRRKYNTQLSKAKNYDLVILKDDLSNTEMANLTTHNFEFPELTIFARTKRFYPFDETYSHSIGYVGRISPKEKSQIERQGLANNYASNEYIGKSGLEKYYEPLLHGIIGKKVIKTDVTGNEIGLISNSPAIDGYSLRLTIDNNLQQLAWNLLGNRKGAIVALNPNTGGVLAFVSKPGFDPNWFIDGISVDDWDDLSTDARKPLLNRAAQSSYPPGSTFKPFLALAALYLGIRTPNYTINDPGYFTLSGSSHRFRDTVAPNGLGIINMKEAITKSSDVYFYKLGLDMGIDRIHKTMSMFGFGNKTGIDLPQENSGLLPSREWKAKRFARDIHQRNWLSADSVTLGIGQGFNNYTPLQMAYAVSIIANNGKKIKPHFLNTIISKDGTVMKNFTESVAYIPIKESQIKFIKTAMQNVVTNGTARSISYGLKYTMAGKTGTAQVVSLKANSRIAKFQGVQFKDHAWFIAFAPVDDPKIAVAIIVENGGFGAATAVPIARRLFDYYILGANASYNNPDKGISINNNTSYAN